MEFLKMKSRKKTECEKNPHSLACLNEQLSNLKLHLTKCQQEIGTGVSGWHNGEIKRLKNLILRHKKDG
tara:strand:- start:100 stop:306 length:207 start_codon:yes stop_codon:yes gene_type:complete